MISFLDTLSQSISNIDIENSVQVLQYCAQVFSM